MAMNFKQNAIQDGSDDQRGAPQGTSPIRYLKQMATRGIQAPPQYAGAMGSQQAATIPVRDVDMDDLTAFNSPDPSVSYHPRKTASKKFRV